MPIFIEKCMPWRPLYIAFASLLKNFYSLEGFPIVTYLRIYLLLFLKLGLWAKRVENHKLSRRAILFLRPYCLLCCSVTQAIPEIFFLVLHLYEPTIASVNFTLCHLWAPTKATAPRRVPFDMRDPYKKSSWRGLGVLLSFIVLSVLSAALKKKIFFMNL